MTDEQQLLLPFDFLEEEQQVNWELPFFDNPQDDNERLLNLQYRYRVNGEQQALGEMYAEAIKIAPKLVAKVCKENKIRLQRIDCEEKAHQAVTYIITSYLKKPRWAIDKSWTGYLYLAAKKQVLGKRKVDGIVDFVDIDDFFKERDDRLANELLDSVMEGNLDETIQTIFI